MPALIPFTGGFPRSMRISLFMPCFNDALFPGTGIAAVKILEKLGHEVEFPGDQTCCGQIHFNTGYRREARVLLKRFLAVFAGSEVVVAPSASCVAMVREQYAELSLGMGDSTLGDAVRELSTRTFELSEFLVAELGVQDLGAAFPHRVALHPTCHSLRSIDIGGAPLRLLENVKDLELVDFHDAEGCCGFGGTFSVKNPHTSLAMLEDKVEHIRESRAEVLTAVDNSCLLHIAGGLHRIGMLSPGSLEGRSLGSVVGRGNGLPMKLSEGADRGLGSGIRVMHLAEILASGWDRTS
jgi:L-lactate dehydrogenase complex protein LldE